MEVYYNWHLPQSILSFRQFGVHQVCGNDNTMKMLTGLPSWSVFEWLFKKLEPKLPYLQYYKGEGSLTQKVYQTNMTSKPGPGRIISHQNEMLLTLMKLRVNSLEEDLALRFGISTSLVSCIWSTWIPFLGLELQPLINWPAVDAISSYYPKCFTKFGHVQAIIDCTEIPLQRPSLPKANHQIYSNYKSRPTCKTLIACTPSGAVSYISFAAGGAMSDKEIVRRSDFMDRISASAQEADRQLVILADRGFNIQELLLPYHVKLVIPPFMKQKKQFTDTQNTRTKRVANARIHVERVIGRIKEFSILKSELPLDMLDLVDHIFTICGAIVNLQPPLVPLE